jgi:hypothetical protein
MPFDAYWGGAYVQGTSTPGGPPLEATFAAVNCTPTTKVLLGATVGDGNTAQTTSVLGASVLMAPSGPNPSGSAQPVPPLWPIVPSTSSGALAYTNTVIYGSVNATTPTLLNFAEPVAQVAVYLGPSGYMTGSPLLTTFGFGTASLGVTLGSSFAPVSAGSVPPQPVPGYANPASGWSFGLGVQDFPVFFPADYTEPDVTGVGAVITGDTAAVSYVLSFTAAANAQPQNYVPVLYVGSNQPCITGVSMNSLVAPAFGIQAVTAWKTPPVFPLGLGVANPWSTTPAVPNVMPLMLPGIGSPYTPLDDGGKSCPSASTLCPASGWVQPDSLQCDAASCAAVCSAEAPSCKYDPQTCASVCAGVCAANTPTCSPCPPCSSSACAEYVADFSHGSCHSSGASAVVPVPRQQQQQGVNQDAIIVGCVLGAVILLLVIGAVVFWMTRIRGSNPATKP